MSKIKAEVLKKELFAKCNPDSQDIAKVTDMTADAMRLGARKILTEYLQDKQPKENALSIKGETYFFKEVVSKTIMTRMGEITVARRTYRNKDGKTYVPLAPSWRTDGEYSAPALREMVAFLAGSNTPTEIEVIFQRFLPGNPRKIIYARLQTGWEALWKRANKSFRKRRSGRKKQTCKRKS